MRLIRTLLLALILLGPTAQAAWHPATDQLDAVPLRTLAPPAAEGKAEGEQSRRPPRVATAIGSSLKLDDGRWSRDGALSVWRLRIAVPGASFLSLHFEDLTLPPGAELYLYDPQLRALRGAYLASTAQGAFWSPLTPGDELVVEVRVPAPSADALRLHIVDVYYGTSDIAKLYTPTKSGSCNVDVACPEGDDWHDEIRSVALVVYVQGRYQYLCSGTLLNDTAQDKIPYLLTAHHCGVDATSAAAVVTYWNFQNSSCGGAADGSLADAVTGSSLLFSDETSDSTLLRLAQAPPASFNVYYAGWDVGGDTPQYGASIHHPSGDEKSISLYQQPASRQDISLSEEGSDEEFEVKAWQIFWSEGVTEPGSSGAGLLNQKRHVVGVLSGGNAACDNQDGADYYGRLDLAWDAGLSRYLDADNTGATEFCGTDASTSCDPEASVPSVPVDDSGDSGGGGAWSANALLALALARLVRVAHRRVATAPR